MEFFTLGLASWDLGSRSLLENTCDGFSTAVAEKRFLEKCTYIKHAAGHSNLSIFEPWIIQSYNYSSVHQPGQSKPKMKSAFLLLLLPLALAALPPKRCDCPGTICPSDEPAVCESDLRLPWHFFIIEVSFATALIKSTPHTQRHTHRETHTHRDTHTQRHTHTETQTHTADFFRNAAARTIIWPNVTKLVAVPLRSSRYQ